MDYSEMNGSGKEKMKAFYNANFLNPFELNQTISRFQWIKIALMTIFLPIRLTLMLTVLVTAWIIGLVTLLELPKEEALGLEPISGWRRRWAKPLISRMARFVFFIAGWYWVPFKGRRASKSEAPILLVMPHSSFFDTALVTILDCPGLVVKDYTAKAPFFGDLIRYTQPLFVKSEDPNCRRLIAEQIQRRVHSEKDFEQLMLFPEGGCGNRKALLQFKLGAFNPGVAVQPIFVRYKNKLDTITWTWEGCSAWKQVFLTLTQFRICCELEFLPVYKPSQEEKKNPRLFATNVQNFVSSWTGCPVSNFSIDDARFFKTVRERQIPVTAPMIKFMRLRASIGRLEMDPAEELHFLQDKNKEIINFHGDENTMAQYLGIQRVPEALKDFFRTINQKSKKKLDVRVYAACLCLIRRDMKVRLKLKNALQAFESETEAEHLSTILLLWRKMPADSYSIKSLNYFDKVESERNGHESRNFL